MTMSENGCRTEFQNNVQNDSLISERAVCQQIKWGYFDMGFAPCHDTEVEWIFLLLLAVFDGLKMLN